MKTLWFKTGILFVGYIVFLIGVVTAAKHGNFVPIVFFMALGIAVMVFGAVLILNTKTAPPEVEPEEPKSVTIQVPMSIEVVTSEGEHRTYTSENKFGVDYNYPVTKANKHMIRVIQRFSVSEKHGGRDSWHVLADLIDASVIDVKWERRTFKVDEYISIPTTPESNTEEI